jgi:phage shock protein PspC (stress-responsive transcriptional regulator)
MSTPHLPPESPAGPAGPDEPAPAGTPPHGPSPDGSGRPTGTDGFFDAVRRAGIARSDDRWIGGVAAGVAERFHIDPLVVRGILFVTFFLSGAGLVLYGAAWALLPERRDGRIHLQEAFRGNFDVAMLGAIAMAVVGLSWGGGWWSWWDYMGLGWLNGLFWVAAIATVAIVAVSVLNQGGPRTGAAQGGPVPGAPAPAPAPAPGEQPYEAGAPPVGPQVPGVTSGVPSADAPWGSPAPTATAQAPAPQAPYAPVPPYAGIPAPPAAPRPPKPPRPPRPPRPGGPGSATIGVVVGLSLLLGALLLVVDRAGDLAWPVFLTWAGASVALAGLAIVVSGLRGRTSGGLGWLAALALVVAVPAASWSDERPTFVLDDSTRSVSDGTHRVTDPDVASEGFGVRWGDPTIDLSDLDLSDVADGDVVEVPVQLGAGDVTVVVPDGVPVRADVQVWAGSARWEVDGERREVSGVSSRPVTFTNEEADAGDDPQLVLLVDVGAGQAIIEEDR